jgi:hypothetical protein
MSGIDKAHWEALSPLLDELLVRFGSIRPLLITALAGPRSPPPAAPLEQF